MIAHHHAAAGGCRLLLAFKNRRRTAAPISCHCSPCRPPTVFRFAGRVATQRVHVLVARYSICHNGVILNSARDSGSLRSPPALHGLERRRRARNLAIRQHLPNATSTNLEPVWCTPLYWPRRKAAAARLLWRLASHWRRCKPDKMFG